MKTDLTLNVQLKRELDESYTIRIGENLFPEIAAYLKDANLGTRYAIVTDSNVKPLYAGALEKSLEQQGLLVSTFSFPAGEANKRVSTCETITDQMSKARFGRDSVILALGGGVVGDMAGFIACVFNRGVPYVQIPTTVLAQADSSVGGKTGVDTQYGKNLWGGFKQPSKVFIDITTIRTLPISEVRNGLAETIKHGVIRDRKFFEYLEDRGVGLVLHQNTNALRYIAETNCRTKLEVVQIDPDEKGLRRILNYGHTAGHAIEKLSDFTIPHGSAVSIGMMIAGRISRELRYFLQSDLERQEQLLLRSGLPVKIPTEITNEAISRLTQIDKKAAKGKARYCLPKRIGEMHDFNGDYATPVETEVVLKALQETR